MNKGYKNLGLSDEALERVATSVETLVTDETDLDAFVKNKAVEALMKFEQADADRKRTAQKKQGEGEKQEANTGNQPQNQQQPDLATAIATAVEAALEKKLNPLQEKLTVFETERTVNSTIADVNTRIDAWGYGKGYPKEMEKARKHAMELYEAYGKKWSADELEAKIKEKFNMEVHDKGIDTTQPFKGDGGGGTDHKSRFEAMAKRQAERQGAVAAE